MIAEGLKYISQLCAITDEVDEEVILHCADSEFCKVHRALQWHGLHRPEELVIRVQPHIGKLILLEEEGFCVSVISHVIKCLTELGKPFFHCCHLFLLVLHKG